MMQKTVINQKIEKDIEVLAEFIEIYCTDRHGDAERERVLSGGAVGAYLETCYQALCGECSKLLLHAASKRLVCPYEPKPSCKKCETHCYAPGHREKIREIMRYSGMRLIQRGRLGLLKKYFL